jgi:hypothetical protein
MEYRKFVLLNARALKLDAKKIRAAKAPILVRVRTSKVDRDSFTRECNEQSVAAMSDFEQAREDASNLDASMLQLFTPAEDGSIATVSNLAFIKAFVARVIAPTERGRFMDREGGLSQAGVRRIQNALLAKAYGDSTVIEKLAEATDNNIRRVAAAILKKSAAFAIMKENITTGARHRFDISEDIAVAVRKLSFLRESGRTVRDYLNQRTLCGEDLTPLQRRLVETFDAYKLSARTIEGILESFLAQVEAFGHPAQTQIFAKPLPTVDEVFEQAIITGTTVERKSKALAKKIKKVSTWDRAAAARKAWTSGKLLAKKLAAQRKAA